MLLKIARQKGFLLAAMVSLSLRIGVLAAGPAGMTPARQTHSEIEKLTAAQQTTGRAVYAAVMLKWLVEDAQQRDANWMERFESDLELIHRALQVSGRGDLIHVLREAALQSVTEGRTDPRFLAAHVAIWDSLQRQNESECQAIHELAARYEATPMAFQTGW